MPSIEVGAEVRMKRALNCWPWGTVVHPLTRGGYPFPGRYAGCVTDGSYQFAMTARFDPKNTEAILLVMERDALDEPCQDFLV
jgi:hypothetical protein